MCNCTLQFAIASAASPPANFDYRRPISSGRPPAIAGPHFPAATSGGRADPGSPTEPLPRADPAGPADPRLVHAQAPCCGHTATARSAWAHHQRAAGTGRGEAGNDVSGEGRIADMEWQAI
jgi:hypothetical protein